MIVHNQMIVFKIKYQIVDLHKLQIVDISPKKNA
jgi:hypothetical protein